MKVREHQSVQPQSRRVAGMSTADVMTRLGAPSLSAARCWIHRKGIQRDGYGRVSPFDVELALRKRSRRGRHPNSLANINTRRSA